MKQNTRTIVIFFSLLSLIILGNCEKDSSSFEELLQPPMENNFSIFDNINIVQSQNGEPTIVSPEGHVKKRLSEIFIEKNSLLNSIDEFGFTKNEIGEHVFFIKEVSSNKVTTIFIPLETFRGLKERGYNWVTKCIGDPCCIECTSHSQLGCACYDLDHNCGPSGPFGCYADNTQITY